MSDVEWHVVQWMLGILGTGFIFLFGLWWKIEARQDRKIDELRKDNIDAHDLLHKRIGTTKNELTKEMTDQHLALRDKIEVLIREVRNGRGAL